MQAFLERVDFPISQLEIYLDLAEKPIKGLMLVTTPMSSPKDLPNSYHERNVSGIKLV